MTAKEWLNNNDLSYDIWSQKYQYEDETLDEWLDRVSGGNRAVRDLILQKKFIFGGRILANRGLNKKFTRKITLSNCYVITPPEDNIESIFETAAKLARTYSYGGGCGVDISNLRPKGSLVNNAAKTTSGAISFMDFYSHVTEIIGQEGRRGALMISIDCNHPDLEDFIDLKLNLNVCTRANISVRVSDEFMMAVQGDKDYLLHWPCNMDISPEEINAIDEYDKMITVDTISGPVYLKKVKARRLFHKLAENNWKMAEPGILYWDNINDYNMLNNNPEFSYAGTNPCAEEPLPAGGSCLLGSINLAEFVDNPFTDLASINVTELTNTVHTAVKALNEVLDEGRDLHPLAEQRQSVSEWRQIGLGVMGLGDMLIKLGIKYGTLQSLCIIEDTMKLIATHSIIESLDLAKEFGPYPKFSPIITDSMFIKNLNLSKGLLDEIKHDGLRNSQLLTCAPTGSIGTMFQVSTGVEPNFRFEFERRTQSLNGGEDTIYKVYAPIVSEYMEATGNGISIRSNTQLQDTTLKFKLPDYFIESQEIKPEDRINVQAALQKYIDASISSTINLPEETTVEQVFDIYMEAWKSGLKGVTIYRDNCQRTPILSTGDKKEEDIPEGVNTNLKRGEIVKVDDNCIGLKRTLVTGCGTLHCEAFFHPKTGELLETYLSKGSKGGCNNFMIGLSRMVSLAARGGLGIDAIIDQLKSCGVCPSYAVRTATQKDTSLGSCCPVAVGNALRDMSIAIQKQIECCEDGELTNQAEVSPTTNPSDAECPNCHHKTLVHSGGCVSCTDCGWTKCD